MGGGFEQAYQDDATRAMIDRVERELRESVENQVLGAVEIGVALEQTKEQTALHLMRVNAAPLESRLRYYAILSLGDDWEDGIEAIRASVADVNFSGDVSLAEDGTSFVWNVTANIRLTRQIEMVYCTVKVDEAR